MHIQKGKLMLSKRDLWNADKTLSQLIVGVLEQFKGESTNKIPPHLYKPLQSFTVNSNGCCNGSSSEQWKDAHSLGLTDEEYEAEWMWLLNKMQDGFREYPDYFDIEPYNFYWDDLSNPEMFGEVVWEDDPVYGKTTEWRQKLKPEYTKEDVDAWWKRYRSYNECVKKQTQEGREYFISYFDSLWG